MRYVIAAHNAVDRMDAKWFKVVVNAHLLEGPLIIHRVRSLHRGSKKKNLSFKHKHKYGKQ